jgi:nucleoside-diphosphate-sugar epimerase
MKIFVVGTTGVLGRALLPLLLQKGYSVRGLVRTPEKAHALEHAGVEAMQGDLLDRETVRLLPEMMKGCQATIHIATAIPRDASAMAVKGAWDITTRLRTEGTQAMLQASLAAGVKRYLQQSIVMAYPDGGSRWLDENTPLDASTERATICGPVIAMEEMIRAIAPEQLQWCILRAGSFVGPETQQENLIAQVRAGQLTVPCNGDHYVSPVNVHDMAEAIVAALATAPMGSTFNIVDEPLRTADYVDHLADLVHAPHPKRQPDQPCPPSFRCSNQVARTLLHWQPVHGIWPAAEKMTI